MLFEHRYRVLQGTRLPHRGVVAEGHIRRVHVRHRNVARCRPDVAAAAYEHDGWKFAADRPRRAVGRPVVDHDDRPAGGASPERPERLHQLRTPVMGNDYDRTAFERCHGRVYRWWIHTCSIYRAGRPPSAGSTTTRPPRSARHTLPDGCTGFSG